MAPRSILHLVVEGLSLARLEELQQSASHAGDNRIEIMPLSESNAAEALARIFAADTVAVWGQLMDKV